MLNQYLYEQVNPPEPVGEISLAEANELRARLKVLATARADAEAAGAAAATAQEAALQASRIATLLTEGLQGWVRQLTDAHALPSEDSYSINDETGVITLVSRRVEMPIAEAVANEPDVAEAAKAN